MNCREFIIEFEDRENLSETATLHLTVCTDCLKISERQTQIWRLIDGLNKVDAPNDFDFRVKARIAQGKPSDSRTPRFLPVLRYVLPLSVVVMLLGLFVYNSAYFFGSQNTPQTAYNVTESTNAETVSPVIQTAAAVSDKDKTLAAPSLTDEKSPTLPANSKLSEKNQYEKVETAKLPSNRQIKSSGKSFEEDLSGGGSRVSSLGVAKPRTPVGINLNANIANAPKIEAPKSVGDEQFLSFFGIETTLESGKRTVKSLVKNSVAERSGVKVGDTVEKIKNDSLTILRGTEKHEITLQNNISQPPR